MRSGEATTILGGAFCRTADTQVAEECLDILDGGGGVDRLALGGRGRDGLVVLLLKAAHERL